MVPKNYLPLLLATPTTTTLEVLLLLLLLLPWSVLMYKAFHTSSPPSLLYASPFTHIHISTCLCYIYSYLATFYIRRISLLPSRLLTSSSTSPRRIASPLSSDNFQISHPTEHFSQFCPSISTRTSSVARTVAVHHRLPASQLSFEFLNPI